MLDLSPALPVLLTLASAAALAVVPFVVPLLRQMLHVQINAQQAAIIDLAVKRGAGAALRFLTDNAGALDKVPLHNTALATGAEYVIRHVPETLHALGITPEHVQDMVHAELGRLLGDPPAAAQEVPVAPAAVAVVADAGSGSAIAKALGAVGLLAVLGLGVGTLSACSPQQAAVAQRIAVQACVVDGVVVPLAQPAVAALGGGTGATIAGVDASVVHPAVVAACAKLNGVPAPAAAVPAAVPTPAAVPVAPVPARAAPVAAAK